MSHNWHISNTIIGSLILLPISFVIGRRPVFLIAVIICFVCFITAGLSQSFESHFLSRVFIGLATGTTETVSQSLIFSSSPRLTLYLAIASYYF